LLHFAVIVSPNCTAPDSTGGAYDAPPDLLFGWEGTAYQHSWLLLTSSTFRHYSPWHTALALITCTVSCCLCP